ncbi:hypothetical protein PR202_gb20037 [Eleusine coracana subsp. coracana]|uniref:Uncharacterized protein n=1 Tax=Eleusine coracana subsp. coracana TaxID=191504 RepID=A0AAV5FBF0_ELECO|nr:hypothetical protein PR202_gb20037 [Eleusine coracana subsp. coracana]
MAPASADELMAAASGSRPALADHEGSQRWLRRCVEATLKGFAIGSGLKGGLALLSVLLRLRRLLTSKSKEPATAMTNAEVVLRAAKDTLRHGIFLGAFAGTYVSVDECISAIWGRNRSVVDLWTETEAQQSAYILNKDSFPSSYKAFLSKQIGKDPVVLQGLKELVNNNDLSSLLRIEKYYETVGVKLKLDPKMKVPCSVSNNIDICIVLCYISYDRIKFHMGWTCLLFRIFKQCNIPLLVLGTFPTGLALLIEKKSRRIEISLYCVARAIESLFTCIVDAGLCPVMLQIKRLDIVVFSIATSIIMHCYDQERDAFRSKYLNVIDWVCGDPGTIHR